MIYEIAQKTGWSFHAILHEISWANLQMMMADAIRITPTGKEEPQEGTDDDLRAMAGGYTEKKEITP